MKKTNFVLSRTAEMRASVYSALKYTLLLLIFTLSVPAFSQSVPKLVDRDQAIDMLSTAIKNLDSYREAMITNKDQIKDAYLKTMADRYEAKFTKLYGFTNKASDEFVRQAQLSYLLHTSLVKQLTSDANMSTEDAVRIILSASNVSPNPDLPVVINSRTEDMRNEIVNLDIIPFLLAN